jgi:hypothetical protein
VCATKRIDRYDTEDTVETHLRKRVKVLRGLCIKLNPFGYAGIPDRLVLLPGGIVAFIELKRPVGGRFEPLQERWHGKLRQLGFRVYVCNTKASVDATLEEICSRT